MISVITATRKRPKHLARTMVDLSRQCFTNFEHIVVLDEPDEYSKSLCFEHGAKCFVLESPGGAGGSKARDAGIRQSSGEYVVFWDDDNSYRYDALFQLDAVSRGFDIGVLQTRHYGDRGGHRIVPRTWSGSFEFAQVDTMCVCVRSELAKSETWFDGNTSSGGDYRWLKKLESHSPTINFRPRVIGSHL